MRPNIQSRDTNLIYLLKMGTSPCMGLNLALEQSRATRASALKLGSNLLNVFFSLLLSAPGSPSLLSPPPTNSEVSASANLSLNHKWAMDILFWVNVPVLSVIRTAQEAKVSRACRFLTRQCLLAIDLAIMTSSMVQVRLRPSGMLATIISVKKETQSCHENWRASAIKKKMRPTTRERMEIILIKFSISDTIGLFAFFASTLPVEIIGSWTNNQDTCGKSISDNYCWLHTCQLHHLSHHCVRPHCHDHTFGVTFNCPGGVKHEVLGLHGVIVGANGVSSFWVAFPREAGIVHKEFVAFDESDVRRDDVAIG